MRVSKVGVVHVAALAAPSPGGCRGSQDRARSSPTSHRETTVFVVDHRGEVWDLDRGEDGPRLERLAQQLAARLGVACEIA